MNKPMNKENNLQYNEQNIITVSDAASIVGETLTRLVNEGIIENDFSQEDEEENEEEYHSIRENGGAALFIINSIASDYSYYNSCDYDNYDIVIDFNELYIIVNMSDDGYLYVSKIEETYINDRNTSIKLWKEVGECINRINNCMKPCDLYNGRFGGRR